MLYGSTFIAGGFRPAIIKQGPKWSRVVFNDGSTVVVRRTKDRLRVEPIQGYTLPKLACRLLRRKNALGGKKHFTKAALAILNEAKGERS